MSDFAGRETFPQYERKRSERLIEKVIMPVSSFGVCWNKYCESSKLRIELELGDGYCQWCLDRGAGRRGFKHLELQKTGRKARGGTDEGRTDTSVKKW